MKITDTLTKNSTAIVGMCKNAGKTTVLNSLIKEMGGICLALTSIGRDGEAVDVATVTPKPEVYVREGTLFATAEDMLKYCDTTLEILEACGIYTPLGEVIAARARSDGYIQIAGPSTVDGLRRIHGILKDFGAEHTVFDGAISRKSLSVPTLCDEFILCSGASYSPSMKVTIEDTAYFAELFTSEKETRFPALDDVKFTLYSGADVIPFESITDVVKALKKSKQADCIRIRGAVTNSIIKPLSECGIKNALIVADDASKLLMDRKLFERCQTLGIKICIEQKSDLRAVTVNPYSVYGAAYDANAFFDGLSAAVSKYGISVFDVKGENYGL